MLKVNYFLFIGWLLCSVSMIGQNDSIPVFEINADTSVMKIPDINWQMLIDSAGDYTIQDIQSDRIASKFHANNTLKPGIGINGLKHFWQRLRIKNKLIREINIVFTNMPAVDECEFFIFRQDSSTEHYLTGEMVPHSRRDGDKLKSAITVTIKPNEEILIYKHLHADVFYQNTEFHIGYFVKDDFIHKAYMDPDKLKRVQWNWFVAGFLLFGFFINFFFFWISREKLYIYMALMLFAEGLWYSTLDKVNFFPEALHLEYYLLNYTTGPIFWYLVAQIVRKFLKTSTYYPGWDKVLLTLLILNVISTPLNDFIIREYFSLRVFDVANWTWQLIFFLLLISLLISFLSFRKEKDRLTNFSVIAAVPVFLVWGIGYNFRNFYSILANYYHWKPSGWLVLLFQNMNIIEMFCVGWFAVLFTWIMFQRYAQLRKQLNRQALEKERERNELIAQQKILLETQVEQRTSELKQSLENLKSAQNQLIQSEKMASLGELTAGIAHEIQNPLNFVNNFSEVSTELVGEMLDELDKGSISEAKEIAGDVVRNLEKINFHGKRADAIVKGMLQHSRSSSGTKEQTEVNALADEYLRLAYHGLRARDKSFNARMSTDFDPSVGKVNLITQDFGRVILNLLTNAFYAVNQRRQAGIAGYEPLVSVTTRDHADNIEIRIKDNGGGIPKQFLDKIFQPFFTTKPTGEGTGLGLSLSYDIVTKGHGGELNVITSENEGTEFIIKIPK